MESSDRYFGHRQVFLLTFDAEVKARLLSVLKRDFPYEQGNDFSPVGKVDGTYGTVLIEFPHEKYIEQRGDGI